MIPSRRQRRSAATASGLCAGALSVLLALPGLTASPLAETTRTLLDDPRIDIPEARLAKLAEADARLRVIVNLRDPRKAGNPIRNFANLEVRQKLVADVRASQARVIDILDASQTRVYDRFTYIFGFSAAVTLRGLQQLSRLPGVLSVDEDPIIEAHLSQGIPLMSATLPRSTHDGTGIAIAICDTGIDYTHPRLGNGGFPNAKVIGGWDTGQDDADPIDAAGHGTACAGLAAGDLGTVSDYIGGVAPAAKLYALKMTHSATGGSAYGSNMVEAWEWCVTHQNDDPTHPITIISTSFGGGRFFDQASCDTDTPAMTTAAANAKAAGITLFVSTGNDGYCDSTGWPGCLSGVVGVGAVYDAAFGWYYPCISSASCAPTKAASSGCSSGYYAADDSAPDLVTSYSNSAPFIDLFAPSNQAYTTDISGSGGYNPGDYTASFGGTSAACPYAAGAAAVLQSAAKTIRGHFLRADEVESYLEAGGDLVTDPKVAITKPRVNLAKSVSDLRNVCGHVWGTWSAAGSPYNVTCDIDVRLGQSLTIETGTLINNLESYSLTSRGQLTWHK